MPNLDTIVQTLTYIKSSGNFNGPEEALAEIKSTIEYDISDSDMDSVHRALSNNNTLVETRTWSEENYATYRSTRQADSENRTSRISLLTDAGWAIKEEINDIDNIDRINFDNT